MTRDTLLLARLKMTSKCSTAGPSATLQPRYRLAQGERIEALNISRELAQEQHTMLLAHLEELEAAWEWRN